jgi:hypothetical protein
MIRLNNGATPLVWHVSRGYNDGLMPYVGRVIAHLRSNERHPFVVWSMSSDDGETFDCSTGDYCATISEAETIFARRAQTVPRRDGPSNQGDNQNG